MEVEFLTADTALPSCLPLPGAMLGLPVSSTAKVMYARLLGEIYTAGTEDMDGILFIHFPIVELAAALGRSAQTCKRTLRESGERQIDPAGASGNWSAEPDLCPHSKKLNR